MLWLDQVNTRQQTERSAKKSKASSRGTDGSTLFQMLQVILSRAYGVFSAAAVMLLTNDHLLNQVTAADSDGRVGWVVQRPYALACRHRHITGNPYETKFL